MDKNRIERKILGHQRKRRNKKIRLLILSIFLIGISCILLLNYFRLSKNEYNKFYEDATLDYTVELKENEYYTKDYEFENNDLIASLINNININFKYSLNLEKNQSYTYNYTILAKTKVQNDSNSISIYEKTDELINKEKQQSDSKTLNINENVQINYDEYNNKISEFVELYELDNTTSFLELEMYVYVISDYDGEQINKESKVMTLSIPLTTNTINISIGQNVVKNEGQIIFQKSQYTTNDIIYMLILGIILGVLGLLNFIKLIIYIFKTRSAETMYDQQLKMILFNYKNYIQKTNNKINEEEYKIIQINTFSEIIGLRDTIQSPILMYTEDNDRRTKFMIINDGLLYIYILGANEIREELRKNATQKRKNI